ncbi:hypothetical protein A7U60_g471 [Sanghuangporus baumii]|uniref:Uncharacterized protein n=1 Tax=Sanghuangporus baumii TaxID=108892 RepID=A0A9Q5I5N3_SANBA|nr:hypothetical protein A7U60_g471 [Sanghuangporus baumii]
MLPRIHHFVRRRRLVGTSFSCGSSHTAQHRLEILSREIFQGSLETQRAFWKLRQPVHSFSARVADFDFIGDVGNLGISQQSSTKNSRG